MPDALKTRVTPEEARITTDHVVERWHHLDKPGREAFLNAVRFTEMRAAALLAYLAESVDVDRDARKNIMRQARDEAKHGYYFSLIMEHLGLDEHPVTADPVGLTPDNPNDLTETPEELRVLTFMVNAEAVELRAAVMFDALNRIFTDDAFVARYLNEIRYDEMFHLGWIGTRLDQLQETRPETAQWREQARDSLAATLTKLENEVDAAARERQAADDPATS
jgi:rubrerythrin